MADRKRSAESIQSSNRALISLFQGYALALESGSCTSGNPEDMEALADNLEGLADEIRVPGRAGLPEVAADPPGVGGPAEGRFTGPPGAAPADAVRRGVVAARSPGRRET